MVNRQEAVRRSEELTETKLWELKQELGGAISIYRVVVSNNLDTVAKGKKMMPPVFFQGSVSI